MELLKNTAFLHFFIYKLNKSRISMGFYFKHSSNPLVRNLKHIKILQHSQVIFPLGIHKNDKDNTNPITFTFE